jgi:mono/diheme cytochrome c family protein
VLGVKTRQLNCDFSYPVGVKDNQLRAWNHAGLFEPRLKEEAFPGYAKLARADDDSRTLEDRARSYLDANCAQCHRPGGTVAYFDARYDTPLASQGLVEGQVLIDEGLDNARPIAPNDRWRSVIFLRMSTLEALKMPPVAHQRLDPEGLALVRKWIESLPGPAVLEPPLITPAAGHYASPVEVTLTEKEPGAAIRYTLDGSAPTKSDPLYEYPIKLSEPTVLRAKAFKPGFTKSITVQGVFMIGD